MKLKTRKILHTLVFVCVVSASAILFNARFALGASNKNLAAVVGDSYAGKMAEVDSEFRFEYFIFPVPGIEQQPNVDIFNKCLDDEDVRYILYTTSVNDQGRMLSPVIFKKFLYTYADLAKEKNKFLFFHTYMNVPHEHIKTVPYKNTDYDNVLQEIASIYANVFYIDMSNFNDDRFVLKDKTHFNTLCI